MIEKMKKGETIKFEWALTLTAEEADPRDYEAEFVFGEITNEMLENLPRKVDLIGIIDETYNQGNVGACTAYGITHNVLIQNIINRGTNKIFVDPKYQWVHNQWKVLLPNTWWDYLEHAASTLKNNGIKWTLENGKQHIFKIDWYVTEAVDTDFQRFLKIITYRLANNQPLYRQLRGTQPIWRECSNWEIVTEYTLAGTTWWHALDLWSIDRDRRKVGFVNSWHWNAQNNAWEYKISKFEIGFDLFEKLLKNKIFNRRYWILFHKEDIPMDNLFIDFAGCDKDSEEYKAVKRAKDNGVIKGVPTPLGNRLEPNRPMTRLETLLVLYRMRK